jgi:acetyl-CoA acyltransferase
MGASISHTKDVGFPFSADMMKRYEESGLPPQGIGADMIADEYDLTRLDLDTFAAESQARAAQATREGRFKNEIVPVPVKVGEQDEMMDADEGIREGTNVEKLGTLNPAFKEDGKITAGNSSQISDGASAVLIMSEEKAKELGYTPRARFHAFAVAGTDPVTMLKGPIPVTRKILDRTGMSIEDLRGQRSLRLGRPGLAEGDGRRYVEGERQWRRHRSRPSARLFGNQTHVHPAQ